MIHTQVVALHIALHRLAAAQIHACASSTLDIRLRKHLPRATRAIAWRTQIQEPVLLEAGHKLTSSP